MEELGVKDQEKTYARWVQYVNDYEDKATLYKGFEEVLETFKNHKIKQAIVSSKLRDQYEIDIVSKGIDQYMGAVGNAGILDCLGYIINLIQSLY